MNTFDTQCSKQEQKMIDWIVQMDKERQELLRAPFPDPERVRALAKKYEKRGMKRTAGELLKLLEESAA